MGKVLKRMGRLLGTAAVIAAEVAVASQEREKKGAAAAARKKKTKPAPPRSAKGKKKKVAPRKPAKRKAVGRKRIVRTVTTPPPAPPPSAVAWPAQRADDFFQHGNPNENNYRQQAINAARAAGLDCIRCRVDYGMGDELAMHLLALEHPNQPGYYLEQDSWFFQAERQGITRWIYDLGTPDMAGAERWLWLTKSPRYNNRLQLLCTAATPADVLAKLKASGRDVIVE